MTDERIDALIRRLDVPSDPGAAFVERTQAALSPTVQLARRQDRQTLARWWAILRSGRGSVGRSPQPVRSLISVVAVALLILALLVTLLLAGALRRVEFGGNGPLVVARGGDLLTIDVATSEVRTIFHEDMPFIALTRSPDGRRMAFWSGPGTGTRFEVANVDGSDRRSIALAPGVVRSGCTEDWSPDSTSIAGTVTDRGAVRILVADVASGRSSIVTPEGVVAECPLWSPDGRTIAIQHHIDDGHTTLALIGRDGTGLRDVSGGVGNLQVIGTNGWSPDGTLVYFGAGDADTIAIFRMNVTTGAVERLTGTDIEANASMVSPDGTIVSFIVWGRGHWDLHIMRSDGTGEHKLLDYATGSGWSRDGRYVLAQWHEPSPGAADGGLTLVTPDGSERRVVLPFDATCPTNPGNGMPRCLAGAGWGEPMP